MIEHAGDCPTARYDTDVVVLLREAVDNGERTTALGVEVVDERLTFIQDPQAIDSEHLHNRRRRTSGTVSHVATGRLVCRFPFVAERVDHTSQ